MERVDPLKRLIDDHEKVSEFLDNMEEIQGLLLNREGWDRIEPVQEFLSRNVADHFAFEEDVIFPALRAGAAESVPPDLISELEREHAAILKDAAEFNRLVSDSGFLIERRMNAGIDEVVGRLIDTILSHASKEDATLLPLVEKNRHLFLERDTS